MSRDVTKLEVFHLSHHVAKEVYCLTARLPDSERFGLQSQLRRAAVSVPANLVEGATRRHLRDWIRFLELALGSASETRYLLLLATELGLLSVAQAKNCQNRTQHLVLGLQKLIATLTALE